MDGPDWSILVGDALAVLPTLASSSVHVCVSSPPYWGLRDYGTATWGGGDPACDHAAPDDAGATDKPTAGQRTHAGRHAGPECRRCGATRTDAQIGIERTPEAYVENLVAVFREVRRILHPTGTLWLNLADSYASSPPGCKGVSRSSRLAGIASGAYRDRLAAGCGTQSDKSRLPGIKQKDLIGIPWMVAFALRADGWYLRQEITWAKPAPMPESVRDRCTKASESVFLLAKSSRYYFDADAIAENAATPPGKVRRIGPAEQAGDRRDECRHTEGDGTRNKRSVWTIPSQMFSGSHYAVMPEALVEPCVLAGSSARGCCRLCRAPWRRVTERTKLRRRRPNDVTKRGGVPGTGNHCGNAVAGVATATTGWSPSCGCEAGEPAPCTVLDCFSGAGTVALVAVRHGRRAIGIELNSDYASLSRERLQKLDMPLFASANPAPPAPEPDLFAPNPGSPP